MNLKSSKKSKHSKLAKLKTSFVHRALISQKCQNIPGPRILGSPHAAARRAPQRRGVELRAHPQDRRLEPRALPGSLLRKQPPAVSPHVPPLARPREPQPGSASVPARPTTSSSCARATSRRATPSRLCRTMRWPRTCATAPTSARGRLCRRRPGRRTTSGTMRSAAFPTRGRAAAVPARLRAALSHRG